MLKFQFHVPQDILYTHAYRTLMFVIWSALLDSIVSLVLNIDADPDPRQTPRDDQAVIQKYFAIKDIVTDLCDGKAGIGVHTSPMWRDRFFESPYVEFWHSWAAAGGDFILHVEEDFYAVPKDGVYGNKGSYFDTALIEEVIKTAVSNFNKLGLSYTGYRGGDNNQTLAIVDILQKAGINIDLSCAPDVIDYKAPIQWFGAPLSAYRMSSKACWLPDETGDQTRMLEIPQGYTREGDGMQVSLIPGKNHLFVDFSTFDDLCRVWDAIVERGRKLESHQIVQLMSHTFSIENPEVRDRLTGFVKYAKENAGAFVSLPEVEKIYQEL